YLVRMHPEKNREVKMNSKQGVVNLLDRKRLRNNFKEIKEKLEKRGEDLSALVGFGDRDERRRTIIAKVEELKARRNKATKKTTQIKKEKQKIIIIKK